MVTAFERETGIKVAMTRKSSGETYAQVKAERQIRAATSGGVAREIRICRRPTRV